LQSCGDHVLIRRRPRVNWTGFSEATGLKGGGVTVCEVHVFPLKVTRQSKQWPEKEQRDVKWLSIKQAAEKVQEPMLSEIIRRLGQKPVD
jgi:hypothetical protein